LLFLSSGALIVAVLIFFGLWPTLFFVLQAVVGIVLLMTAAYIQHYGILRKDDIHLEAHHVWDSNYRLSNWINFGVQRHAAHHLAPTRLYVTHRSYQEAPELPAGYPAMITLALVPFFWMRVMNHRVPARAMPRPSGRNDNVFTHIT
jgi:alkane 1-monooxygenase